MTSPGATEAAGRAASIYFQSGLVRRASIRGFWPLFFVRLVTDVQLSPLQLVLLGTVMEVTILLMEVPTGVVADVYSRKWSVVVSYLVMGIAIVLSGLVSPYWLLVVAQILMGFGNTFETGAETAWITSEIGSSEATEPIILRRARWQLIAGVVGILFWAGLAAVTTLSTALVLIGVCYAGWGLWLGLRMPETNFTRRSGEGYRESVAMFMDGFGQAKTIAALRILVLVMFLGGLAKEAIDRLDVQRLVDVGLPTDFDEVVVIGAITAVKLLLAAGLLLVVRNRSTGSGVVMSLALMMAGAALGVVLLAHMEILALTALGLMLQGGFLTATEPLVTTWTNNFASDNARATVHSFMGQSEAFGEILGGMALGVVAQLTTVPTAMTFSAVLFFAAAVLASTARRAWAT